jgi:hypothetical protein
MAKETRALITELQYCTNKQNNPDRLVGQVHFRGNKHVSPYLRAKLAGLLGTSTIILCGFAHCRVSFEHGEFECCFCNHARSALAWPLAL